MSDAISHRRAASASQATDERHTGHDSRQNFIHCRQCSKRFPGRMVICPRCDRLNYRSPFVLGITVLALVLFVCTITWVVRVAARSTSTGAEIRTVPDGSPSPANPPDVQF